MISGSIGGLACIANIDFTTFVISPVGIAANYLTCGILHVDPICREEWNGVGVCEGVAKSYKSAWKLSVGFIDVAPDVIGTGERARNRST